MMMSQQRQVKKTRTFQLQKTPSSIQEHQFTAHSPIDQYYYSTSSTFVPERSPPPPPPVEYPTSPQNIYGQEIIHYSHPHHALKMVDTRDLFTCAGCKEYGSGKRFACRDCEFQLHDFCALAPPALKAHPLHSQHSLLFHSNKSAKSGKSKCDICGKPTKGFAFICTACGFQMHPCCAMLNTEIDYKPHPHTLEILPATATASAADSNGIVCGECKRKRSGRVYRCTMCNYCLHAFCAKSKVNGLQANNIKLPEKQSAIAAAARVASQVVIEFIGGLVEGLGEGVGEVLVQSIAKGNGNEVNTSTNTSTSTSTRTRP